MDCISYLCLIISLHFQTIYCDPVLLPLTTAILLNVVYLAPTPHLLLAVLTHLLLMTLQILVTQTNEAKTNKRPASHLARVWPELGTNELIDHLPIDADLACRAGRLGSGGSLTIMSNSPPTRSDYLKVACIIRKCEFIPSDFCLIWVWHKALEYLI